MHKDVKLLHKNICPESIIININGAWKLAGFELYVTSTTDPNGSVSFYLLFLLLILIQAKFTSDSLSFLKAMENNKNKQFS